MNSFTIGTEAYRERNPPTAPATLGDTNSRQPPADTTACRDSHSGSAQHCEYGGHQPAQGAWGMGVVDQVRAGIGTAYEKT
jgi:hypothetical protein